MPGDPGRADGVAVRIARSAAASRPEVQLVGRVGDDPEGDLLLLDLAKSGIGHVAVIRDAGARTPVARPEPDEPATYDLDEDDPVEAGLGVPDGLPLEAGDVELALRYLTDFRVLVVADPLPADALRVASEAASFAGAQLVAVTGSLVDLQLPEATTVLGESPAGDAAGFARLVGAYAAALDAGVEPKLAFRDAAAGVSAEAAATDS